MKLIIDVPEEYYKSAKLMVEKGSTYPLKVSIANGIPLDDVTEAISEKYTNTHYMYPEYASGLSYAYGIIDKCIRKAERDVIK